MTVQDVQAFLQERGSAYLRYVRVNGEYRFADVTYGGIEHIGLANGDPVESAAFVKIKPDGLYVEGYSMTLGIGQSSNDEDNLSALLGIPIKGKWA